MLFPKLLYNKITLIGLVLAAVSGSTMLFFFFAQSNNPYVGIFVYMILPPFVLLGLVLVPVGMVRQWKRVRRYGRSVLPEWPLVDFNKPQHRNAFVAFIVITGIYVLVSATGAYQAYHYSESVEFCGTTCHVVMKPEHTAYQNSSHARVPCTSCHVGEGAGWYARSKLSGAYQVYATTFDKFPRPIPTPIKNLRPAQETCERCHWPEKFFGAQQRQFVHYMYNEDNTEWRINMLIKTGGGDAKTGLTSGIHWHMNIANKIEYIARDAKRQDIPWIRITSSKGAVTVYQDQDDPLSEEEIAASTPRRMDCMDCHNRPSHKYPSPDFSVDRALLTGKIDPTLPEIKLTAVDAMDQDYESEPDAMDGIAAAVSEFYEEDYPEIYEERRQSVESAIDAIQYAYSQSIFPEMGVRWDRYHDNIGHFINKGCMRCHDGNKASEDGKTITRDCTACHTILAQGPGGDIDVASTQEGLVFRHPDPDYAEDWQDTGCYECHEGVQP